MTDKPYQGRRGGRYVRASREEEPRRVEEKLAGASESKPPVHDDKGDAAAISETASPETGIGAKQTAGKPARKRSRP